ncbi:MAG: universal stress protein [Deltaproteobacteria bacterium]|nr:universal stress protein [Deltaproteobacteria bacterium]MBW1738434.1 universal stress protein [Deltaproteobacteria bacterium]MBW1908936.1 universal stress protein [Deltaproteobacteria bacterium]MBW2034478.1 universal stress protein [Deltaproteobacteria bacterium]MBW2115541.1 universal stress protein [Deltaproteobacteria bacterium]
MNNSILVPLNDSMSSRSVVDYLARLAFCPEDAHITLIHLFKKPTASEDLMGKKFTEEQPARFSAVLEKAKDKLIENGFNPNNIEIELVTDPYPTVAEGIIDQFKKKHFDMVIIGRKHMSKAEEFVMGDVSVKLVRALEGTAVLVVKSE